MKRLRRWWRQRSQTRADVPVSSPVAVELQRWASELNRVADEMLASTDEKGTT